MGCGLERPLLSDGAGGSFGRDLCDSVHFVVRLLRACFVIALALGPSGCLLFTDPINEAPKVKIQEHPDPVYRGFDTDFYVQVSDDQSPPPSYVRWSEFTNEDEEGCTWVTLAEWTKLLEPPQLISSDAPYSLNTSARHVTCLCAQAVDQEGAAGQDCARIEPLTKPPEAGITALPGSSVAGPQPKCSQIQLSAAGSKFVEADDIQFKWTLEYAGQDPAGNQSQLVDCPGLTPPKPYAYQCFYAAAPGVYTVTLTITDTPLGMAGATSEPASLGITILEDTPACLEQTSPVMTAKWIVLEKYASRTFTVDSVKDDCEPFPPRRDTPTLQESMFVWYVLDGTTGQTDWRVQPNPANSNSFTIDQQSFPNARPGDTIGLRVEIRDTPAQLLYQTAGPLCSDATAVCCGAGGCTGTNDCIRWTTWTVEFRP
jgi:hypothetical protein